MPISAHRTPALMAAFPINAARAAALLPPGMQPLRLWHRSLLLITVVDYRETVIGRYIEFSVAIAVTRGDRPAPRLLPLLLQGPFGFGQYVYDLPVSTEISVKGGKGIWGMPKHRESLDFLVGERVVSSQYDLDGEPAVRIDIERPRAAWLPLRSSAVNYCEFRGMLFKSVIGFQGRGGVTLFRRAAATLQLGDQDRIRPLKELEIDRHPLFVGFFPDLTGVLDDHVESWFLTYDQPPEVATEGLESVVALGLSRAWPPPPRRDGTSTLGVRRR
ncbi:MAG: acetoacetate decarboxylase family protein [Candidatus Dormibacteraeota bacterium]|nr:acetoacetate decarboxylase family protein [Candidatus Dormibacteraeota bacterium]